MKMIYLIHIAKQDMNISFELLGHEDCFIRRLYFFTVTLQRNFTAYYCFRAAEQRT